MKRRLLLLLILLGTGAVLGVVLQQDPGYALLSWHRTAIEMSLWVAGLLWFGSVLAAVAVIDVLSSVLGAQQWWQRWRGNRNLRRSAQHFEDGTAAFERGDWARAERLLLSAATLSSHPLPAYLAAARAAEQGQALDRAEQYLVLAEERGNRLSVGLVRARLLLASGRWERAVVLLAHLHSQYRRDEQILMLWVEALTRLQRWAELADLLPRVQKRSAADEERFATIELRANREVLHWMALAGGRVDRRHAVKTLRQYWDALPRRLRHDESLLAAYANELVGIGADDEAEALLASALSKQWSNAGIEVYGRARSTRPDSALRYAESWRSAHPHNPALMLALGRLHLQLRQWDNARQCFESSLALRATPEAYAELMRLLAHWPAAAEPSAAAQRQLIASLSHLSAKLPDLPLPAAGSKIPS